MEQTNKQIIKKIMKISQKKSIIMKIIVLFDEMNLNCNILYAFQPIIIIIIGCFISNEIAHRES